MCSCSARTKSTYHNNSWNTTSRIYMLRGRTQIKWLMRHPMQSWQTRKFETAWATRAISQTAKWPLGSHRCFQEWFREPVCLGLSRSKAFSTRANIQRIDRDSFSITWVETEESSWSLQTQMMPRKCSWLDVISNWKQTPSWTVRYIQTNTKSDNTALKGKNNWQLPNSGAKRNLRQLQSRRTCPWMENTSTPMMNP